MRQPVMRMLGAVLVCAGVSVALAGGVGARAAAAAAAGDDWRWLRPTRLLSVP